MFINLKKYLFIILFLPLFVRSAEIYTTLPEFRWVVKQLAPTLDVQSLLTGNEDPHYIDASPSFVFKLAKSKMIIFNGMDLEVGWLPKVIEQTGNLAIQTGQQGSCDASTYVEKIEKLEKFDRSLGDVHPLGNPHYTISLETMKVVVKKIQECLSPFVDSKTLEKNGKLLIEKINSTQSKIKKLNSTVYYVFHREFNYLQKDLDLKIIESLEEVPGVLPSATYLAKISKKSLTDKPKKVLATNSASLKLLEKFKEMSGVNYAVLSIHPQNNEDYLKFIENLYQEISK